MSPQTPPPDGKPFATVYTAAPSVTEHATLEDAEKNYDWLFDQAAFGDEIKLMAFQDGEWQTTRLKVITPSDK